jgi:nucleoside-diphosphate-sugar epimerase
MEINLVTGSHGFLCGHLCKYLPNALDYGNVLHYYNIDYIGAVYHFAGPSDDYDFKDADKTLDTIVNGTHNMLRVAKRNHAKFIFASTVGVENPNNVYCYSKLLMEQYIIDNYDDYIILRIPRVYDKSRKKGLMKKLHLGHVSKNDMSNVIEYITLTSFLEQTITALNHKNIIYNYNNIQSDTIKEIHEKYKG